MIVSRTQQYGISIRYVGHAEEWDTVDIEGSLQARDCAFKYQLGGRTLAVATISPDLPNLQVEAEMEDSLRSALGPGG
jgi:hypothetical protein